VCSSDLRPMQGTEGTVVLSVTGNTGRVAQFDAISIKQYVKPEPGVAPIKGEYILRQLSPGLARDTAFFVGVVPAGEYVLAKFSHDKTQRYINLNDKSIERIGHFRVTAGAVSDLGRIIVTPLNDKVVVGRSQRVRSNADLVKRFAPESAGIYSSEVSQGWVGPRDPTDVVEEYALQRPVGADAMTELPNGWVIAASRLGTVLVRAPAGMWRAIQGDSLESLLWVKQYETENSLLLAVGEFDTMLRLNRQGQMVRVDSGNLPPGNLLFVDGNDAAGWFVAIQHGKEITVFRSAILEGGDWRQLRKESVEMSFWSGANQFWTWSTKNGFAYAVSEGRICFYDFQTQQWAERKAPKDARIIRIAPQPGDTLGILTSPGGGVGGIFASNYLSRDAGATWEEMKSPFRVKVAPPYLTPNGALLMQGGAFGSPEIQESRDLGKTWRRISDKISLEEQIVVLPTKGLFAVSSGSLSGIATIKHSEDWGQSWRTEYSNFDEAAYDAQKQKSK